MKLYAFHKVARPVTDYLNRLRIPFAFRPSGRCCTLIVPLFGVYDSTKFADLIHSCGLCFVVENLNIIIF